MKRDITFFILLRLPICGYFYRMVEYSDISWYISFEKSYNEDRKKVEELYGTRNDFDSKSIIDARPGDPKMFEFSLERILYTDFVTCSSL